MTESTFNVVDIVALVIVVYGMVRGWMRGLSGELARLIGLGTAVVAGWLFYLPFSDRIAEFTRLSLKASGLTAFVVLFLAAGFAMVLLRWCLRNIAEFKFKPPFEQIGGLIAGGLRCLCILITVILVATLSPSGYLQRIFGEESALGRTVTHVLLPAYNQLAEDHPQLDLPKVGDHEGHKLDEESPVEEEGERE
jgi:uncharacterized membrane protein required for colicin V production